MELDWAKWPWQQCRACKEPNKSGYWGRCELRKGHAGDHALERAFDTPRWSTEWTDDFRRLSAEVRWCGKRSDHPAHRWGVDEKPEPDLSKDEFLCLGGWDGRKVKL